MTLDDHQALNLGRLFRMKLQRSEVARRDALASIKELPKKITVRIGGRIRGRTVVCSSRREAEALVREHYNQKLFDFIIEQKRRLAFDIARDLHAKETK